MTSRFLAVQTDQTLLLQTQGGQSVPATPVEIAPGGVVAVTASAPLASSGGASPNIAATGALTDDLAGSTLEAPFVAALTGAGGTPGPIPVADGASLEFPDGQPVATAGALRFSALGVPAASDGGIIVVRNFDNTGNLPVLAYNNQNGWLTFGNAGFIDPATAWPAVAIAAQSLTSFFDGTTSENTNSGGQWRFFGIDAPNIAVFYDDDWTVMWEQGAPGKDGRRRPLGYNTTFQTARCNVFALDVATTHTLVDNAINVPEYVVVMWDFITDAPAYRWAVWKLTKSFGVVAGVPTAGAIAATVTLVDEFPAGVSTGVSPDFAIDGNYVVIGVTPPVATALRWYAGIDMPQVSDTGTDQSPSVPDGPGPPPS